MNTGSMLYSSSRLFSKLMVSSILTRIDKQFLQKRKKGWHSPNFGDELYLNLSPKLSSPTSATHINVLVVIIEINFYIANLFLLKASSLLVFQAAVTKSMQFPPKMAADPIRQVKIKTYNRQWSNTKATYFHSAFDLLSGIHAPIYLLVDSAGP